MNHLTPMKPDLERALFAEDMIRGLLASPKATSPKWFYDSAGSALFGQITQLPEYYPTRTEMALLANRGKDISEAVGPGRTVVEYGSGSAAKAVALLSALQQPAGYLCVEIDPGAARATAAEVALVFPNLPVLGVAGDFTALQGEVAAGAHTARTFHNVHVQDHPDLYGGTVCTCHSIVGPASQPCTCDARHPSARRRPVHMGEDGITAQALPCRSDAGARSGVGSDFSHLLLLR
jgi:hypothetical protein